MNRITGLCLLILLASFLAPKGHAFTAYCDRFISMDEEFFEVKDNHRGLQSKITLDCAFKLKGKGNWANSQIRLTTTGPGLESTGSAGIVISCPLVSQKRLDKVIKRKGSWSAVGVDASAGFAFGGRAGVGINHRGAICFLAGAAIFDFGASAGVMEIKVLQSPLAKQE